MPPQVSLRYKRYREEKARGPRRQKLECSSLKGAAGGAGCWEGKGSILPSGLQGSRTRQHHSFGLLASRNVEEQCSCCKLSWYKILRNYHKSSSSFTKDRIYVSDFYSFGQYEQGALTMHVESGSHLTCFNISSIFGTLVSFS